MPERQAASPRKTCKNGHRYRKGSYRIDSRGNRECLHCVREYYRRKLEKARAKALERKRIAAELRAKGFTRVCPGCGASFTTKVEKVVTCPACLKDPAAKAKARQARNIILSDEQDREALAQIEASKKPTLNRTPIGAEALIARWQRGGW